MLLHFYHTYSGRNNVPAPVVSSCHWVFALLVNHTSHFYFHVFAGCFCDMINEVSLLIFWFQIESLTVQCNIVTNVNAATFGHRQSAWKQRVWDSGSHNIQRRYLGLNCTHPWSSKENYINRVLFSTANVRAPIAGKAATGFTLVND